MSSWRPRAYEAGSYEIALMVSKGGQSILPNVRVLVFDDDPKIVAERSLSMDELRSVLDILPTATDSKSHTCHADPLGQGICKCGCA